MKDQNQKIIAVVISKFNQAKGRHYRFTGPSSPYAMYEELIEASGLGALVSEVSVWDNDDIVAFLDAMTLKYCKRENGEASPANPEPAPVQPNPEREAPAVGLGMLETAIANGIAKSILGEVEQRCDNFIRETYGTLPKVLRIERPDGHRDLHGIFHEKFDEVLTFVNEEIPVYLAGPAGSGKNNICKQVADALGLDFYFSNAVTQEYKLTGFTDANGTFHQSQFYKAFFGGGLFMLDEMDASVPEVLIILNAAIANGYFDFPAPIGKVEAHPDFRVVSAGNTFGLGASSEYTGRYQLDAASLDRFAVIEIDYSKVIEMAVSDDNVDLVKFIRKYRSACENAGIQSIASYRAIARIDVMEKKLGTQRAMETCLLKNLKKEDLKMLVGEISDSSEYGKALRELASS